MKRYLVCAIRCSLLAVRMKAARCKPQAMDHRAPAHLHIFTSLVSGEITKNAKIRRLLRASFCLSFELLRLKRQT